MTIPIWVSSTIQALYGKDYGRGVTVDVQGVRVLRTYVEPTWAFLANRFPGVTGPEPLIVPLDSPAGRPTTFADNGTRVLAFDLHLFPLFYVLTTISALETSAETVVPALTSIYAERAFSAGNITTAAILSAGARRAVTSNRPLALSEMDHNFLFALCRGQLGFVVAHELAHLIYSGQPDAAAEYADNHGQILGEIIGATYPSTVERGDREPVLERLAQQGYGLNDRSRFFIFGEALGKVKETESPVPIPEAWDLVRTDKEFMIEVWADHVACIALLVLLRMDFTPEFLATAATFAVNNLSILHYLDQIIAGDHPSLARQPLAPFWKAYMRQIALHQSLGLVAAWQEKQGEPRYQRSLPRITDATSGAKEAFMHILEPLIYSIDFDRLERQYSADETIARTAHEVSTTSESTRQFLGFGSAETTDFTKYLNIGLRGDSSQNDSGNDTSSKPTGIKPDNGGFQHYVADDAIIEAISDQQPVTAVCGWSWVPKQSPQAGDDLGGLPVCPTCEQIYADLPETGDVVSAADSPGQPETVAPQQTQEVLADTTPANLARSSNDLAARLLAEGRAVEALPVIQEAVAQLRELAAADPRQYRVSLAISLRNLTRTSLNLGKAPEALTTAREALGIEREIYASGYMNYKELARSLRDLGIALSKLELPGDALAATREAVELIRPWYELSPDGWRHDIALALDELGVRFSELGRPDDGLAAAKEAVEILRELASDDPPAYRPDLARALHNLSYVLALLQRSEALSVSQETVDIRRELAAGNPGAHRDDLGRSLNGLAIQLLDAGRPADALLAAQEAIEILRALALDNPGMYRPVLAASLLTLARTLPELDRFTEAVPVADEAVKIFRELAADNPGQYRGELAASLNSLNLTLSDVNRSADALPLAQEVVEIFRQLASETHAGARDALAESLISLALLLAELDQSVEAVTVGQEAVQIFRELVEGNPVGHRGALAASLHFLALTLGKLHRPSEALPMAHEAVNIFRGLVHESPDQYRTGLTDSLQNLSDLLAEQNQMTAARAASEEAAQHGQQPGR